MIGHFCLSKGQLDELQALHKNMLPIKSRKYEDLQ